MASRLVRTLPRVCSLVARRYAATATAAKPHVKASDELRLTFAAPDKAFFSDAVVKQVDVPTMAGVVGILAKHVPVLGVLKPGVVSVTDLEGNVKKTFVSSGTLSMNIDGSCQVLAEEAINIEDIDETATRQELDLAQRRIQESGSEAEKAEASIAIEVCEALLKAVTGQQ